MSKPTKKPRKPSKARVVRDLTKLVKDWRTWQAAGMPKRPPVSAAELARRIALTEDALALLHGEKA